MVRFSFLLILISLVSGVSLFAVVILLRAFAGLWKVTTPLRILGRLIAGVLALTLLPVTLFELLLRRWAGRPLWSLKRRQPTFAKHQPDGQGSWVLPSQVAASRDASFSAIHWQEMVEGLGCIVEERWRQDAGGPELYRLGGRYEGSEFSFSGGERGTTGWPSPHDAEIFCLGGSTTFCMEVPDGSTWPSVLQKRILESNSRRFRVRNQGIPGTPGLERIQTFLTATPLNRGDIAVFLFGDNDSGWKMYGAREGKVHSHLPYALRELLRAAEVSEIAGWLYGEFAPRFLRRLAIEMAETTIAAAERAVVFAEARGVKVLFVLQPNLFTLVQPDEWDCKIIGATARDLTVLIEAAYGRYREWTAKYSFAVDATSLFDGELPSPYMGDWAHVNTRGNQLLGEFIYKELEFRKWLSMPTKLNLQ